MSEFVTKAKSAFFCRGLNLFVCFSFFQKLGFRLNLAAKERGNNKNYFVNLVHFIVPSFLT